jgi:WD40 repeat protein
MMSDIKSNTILLLILTTYSNGHAAAGYYDIIGSKKVALQSKEGEIFEVTQELLSKYSEPLRHMFQDSMPEDRPIPLEHVTSNALKTIIGCLKNPGMISRILSSLNERDLLSVTQAVNFLGIGELSVHLPQIKWISRLLPLSKILLKHHDAVRALAISSNSRFVVTGTDTEIKIWDARSGGYIRGWTWCNKTPALLVQIAISPDRSFIAALLHNGGIRTWETMTGKFLQAFEGITNPLLSLTTNLGTLVVSPDGSFVVTKSGRRELALWNPRSGECLKKFNIDEAIQAARRFHNPSGNFETALYVLISPNGKYMVVSSHIAASITVLDIRLGKCVTVLQDRIMQTPLAISPDSKFVACGYIEQLNIIDIISGRYIKKINQGLGNMVVSVAISSDNTRVAVGTDRGQVKIWDIVSGSCLKTLNGHTGPIRNVSIHDDDSVVITHSCDGTIKMWDLKSETCFRTLPWNTERAKLEISADGASIATHSTGQTGTLWSSQFPDLIWPQLELLTRIYIQTNKSEKLTIKSQSADERTLASLAEPIRSILRQHIM